MTEISSGVEALGRILDSRESVCAVAESTRQRFDGRPLSVLLEALADVQDYRQKVVLGLLTARSTWDIAQRSPTIRNLDAAVFRTAHHFRTVGQSQRAPADVRMPAKTAAQDLFLCLKHPPNQEITGTARHGGSSSEESWVATTGLDRTIWNLELELVRAPLHQSKATPEKTLHPIADVDLPSWLHLSSADRLDSFTNSKGPWDDRHPGGSSDSDIDLLNQAVTALLAGEFHTADTAATNLANRRGASWGPSVSVEDQETWSLLRAIRHLSEASSGSTSERRIAFLSATELLHGLELDTHLVGDSAAKALQGLDPWSPHAQSEWSVIASRLLSVLSHKDVADYWSNEERAHLRTLASKRFETPAASLRDLSAELGSIRASVYQMLRDLYPGSVVSRYRQLRRQLTPLLTQPEADIAHQTDSVLERARALNQKGSAEERIRLALALASDLDAVVSDIRDSRSALLQDILLPVLSVVRSEVSDAKREAGRLSRPDIVFSLLSDRLPLWGQSKEDIPVRVSLRNRGNAPARSIEVEVGSHQARTPRTSCAIEGLAPGETAAASFDINVDEALESLVLHTDVSWQDAFGQHFDASSDLIAECERASQWTANDLNPYNLFPIRHREQLYGRSGELDELRSIIAGSGSIFVTGQKRVGKSSLVEVCLAGFREISTSARRVPFGYLEAQDMGQLILNLAITVHELLQEVLGPKTPALPDLDANRAAGAVGRWLSSVTAMAGDTLRVVLAIDDFDELPRRFFMDDNTAGSLFVFLRAVVEEPWLSIVFIGSEIMPSLMHSQGYKLNQVHRFDVRRLQLESDTASLLRDRTRQNLEWSDSAVRLVHQLSGGNPYFATLLARDVWDRLRKRNRSFVGDVDIRECADIFSERAEKDHFVHLWADGPDGIDTQSDSATETASVLYALAHCAGDRDSAPRSEVLDYAAARSGGGNTDLLTERLERLLERHVLHEASASSVAFEIPLAQMWFLRSGPKRLGPQIRQLVAAAQESAHIIEADIISVADRFAEIDPTISDIRIRDWINQFQDASLRVAAFRMLETLSNEGIFDDHRIAEIGKTIRGKLAALPIWRLVSIKANGTHTENVLLVPVFPEDLFAVKKLATGLQVPLADITSVSKLSGRLASRATPSVVLVVTVFDGQLTEIEATATAVHEIAKDSGATITAAAISIASINSASGLDVQVDEGLTIPRLVGATIGHGPLRPFHPRSPNLGDAETVAGLAAKFSRIGNALDVDSPLGWPPHGLLIIFPGTLPIFLPAVFWAAGTYMGAKWRPLLKSGAPWPGAIPNLTQDEYDVLELISSGESNRLEFKSSLRTNAPEGDKNTLLEWVASQEVASFLNTDGGQLLLGVHDDKYVLGLEADYLSSSKIGGRDGFERHLRGVLQKHLDGLMPTDVSVEFAATNAGDVCIVSCSRSIEPVYTIRNDRGKRELEFYFRNGSSATPIQGPVLVEYIRTRFQNR